MKPLRVGSVALGLTVVAVGAAMAFTNPGVDEYEAYATQRLSEYLKTRVCPDVPGILGDFLGNACVSLVDDNQQQIQTVISQGTTRQNYWLISIYTTHLSADQILSEDWIDGVLPEYHTKTLGIFRQFYTYRVTNSSNSQN